MNYGIQAPDGTMLFPNGRTEFSNDGWTWKWSREKVKWGIENGFIVIEPSSRKSSGWAVKYKNYIKVDNEGMPYNRSAAYKNLILGVIGSSKELNDLLGGNYFKNPKPSQLIYILLTYIRDADIVLDFFSGFRVIIMTQANSQVNTRVLELLPKFKIKKMNCWCAV